MGAKNRLINVGIARADITPQTPIRLSGYAARSKFETDKVLHRLYAKALVFGNDKKSLFVFITVDLLGIQWRTTNKLVNALSKKINIKPQQIVVTASHTHGGPEIGNLINHLQCEGDYPKKFHFSNELLNVEQLVHIAQYSEMLAEKLEEVALEAINNLKPAQLSWGLGSASFAENRRSQNGPIDHTLSVLQIADAKGSLKAVLLNYACHGIALGPQVNKIHGDWMGEAQNVIEARHPGVTAMVSIGCAGELHPVKRDKMEYLKMYGEHIADCVDEVLSAKMKLLTHPSAKMVWVKLPFAKVPTTPELIELLKDPSIKSYYARLALYAIQRGERLPEELDYPLQVWQFGNKMCMINMSGEVGVEYALNLKKEFGSDRIWINSFANDAPCYISSKKVIQEGGYEPDISMYWYNQPGPLSDKIESIILNAVRKLIPSSFVQDAITKSSKKSDNGGKN